MDRLFLDYSRGFVVHHELIAGTAIAKKLTRDKHKDKTLQHSAAEPQPKTYHGDTEAQRGKATTKSNHSQHRVNGVNRGKDEENQKTSPRRHGDTEARRKSTISAATVIEAGFMRGLRKFKSLPQEHGEKSRGHGEILKNGEMRPNSI